MEVQRNYAIAMMFSLGYLIFDEITIRFIWHDPYANKMTMQMSLHHYIVGIYLFFSFASGYSLASTNSVGLLCEFSTFLLNMTEMMTVKEGCLFSTI